jgi:MFS transporter, AAHS family, benzoate transport protein
MTAIREKRQSSWVVVVALCWLTILFDGYDLTVYGTVVPSLLADDSWHLTPVEAGAIGSWALFGMLLGSLVVGTVTEVIGRRRTFLSSVILFSAMMGVAAVMPTPALFGAARFLAGIGLGGLMPTAMAITTEFARAGRRNITLVAMFTGFSAGGVLAALLGIAVIPAFGWRAMFWIGVLPLAVVVPLVWRLLPESPTFLAAAGRRKEAEEVAARYGIPVPDVAESSARQRVPLAAMFTSGRARATLSFWSASFMGLLLVYGLNTWLPQIMRQSGYSLGSALSFLLVLNAGAIVGLLIIGAAADRFGTKPIAIIAFMCATVAVIGLSTAPPLAASYVFVALAGLGSTGTQTLVSSLVTQYYAPQIRAGALGVTLAVGRAGAMAGPLIGGWIVGSSLGFAANFVVFAIAAVLGALLVAAVPWSRRYRPAATPQPDSARTVDV